MEANESRETIHRLAIVGACDSAPMAEIAFLKDGHRLFVDVTGDESLRAELTALCATAGLSLNGDNGQERQDPEALIASVSDALIKAGHTVTDLPSHEANFSFHLDQTSGVMLGTASPARPYTSEERDIGINIGRALQQAFSRPMRELADDINLHVAEGDHSGAVNALLAVHQSGLMFGTVPASLFDALLRVDTQAIDQEQMSKFLSLRVGISETLDRHEEVEDDAQWLLAHDPNLTEVFRQNLETFLGVAEVKSGRPESGLTRWQALVQATPAPSPGLRGWLWRNISSVLKDGDEALRAIRLSADAFLEAGEKTQATASYLRESRLLERTSPEAALDKIDEIVKLATNQDLLTNQLKAGLHHTKATRLLELRRGPEALAEAETTITLCRNVIGMEDDLIAALYLASVAAEIAGDNEAQVRFRTEANAIEPLANEQYLTIARQIEASLKAYDAATAKQLIADAKATGQVNLISGATLSMIIGDKSQTPAGRLSKLEALLYEIDRLGARGHQRQPTLLALTHVLLELGQPDRAIRYIERAQKAKPSDLSVASLLAQTYQAAERWPEAASAYQRLVDKFGQTDREVLLLAQALLKCDDPQAAFGHLKRFLERDDLPPEIRELALNLRNDAMDRLVGTPPVPPAPVRHNNATAVLADEVHQAMTAFSKHMSADQRMSLWNKPDKQADHEWIPNPEKYAQHLTHTFLKGTFGDRVSAFQEVVAGAGRLDLLMTFQGGLRVVLELKMCGFRYSAPYAAAGEDQIYHYMDARDCHIGYLVVFDARLNHNGAPLLSDHSQGANTVREILIDVTPRIAASRGRPAKNSGKPSA